MNEVEPSTAIAGSAPGAAQASCARWLKEIARAEKHREEWLRRSESVLKLYRRQKSLAADAGIRSFAMLWANTEVLKPSIYARPPAPQVSRRYRDRDPVGRLAAEILERNTAFELERMNLDQVLRNCRDDLLLPGRGAAWVRYEADISPDPRGSGGPAEAREPAPAEAGVKAERVQVDYVHWKCFLHGPARTWEEVTWVARQGYFAADELEARFRIKERQLEVALDHSEKRGDDPRGSEGPTEAGGEAKATVWEIWCRKSNKVYFIARGCDQPLEETEPFVDLTGFWPCPRPLFATLTTDTLIPVPDYFYYEDQAKEIDALTARIGKLTDCLKLVGFYAAGDRNAAAIEKALEPGVENRVIAVESWAVFSEKGAGGGLAWLPVKDVAAVLKECVALRNQLIEDVYQITGLSDIQRGATDPAETASAQELKSRFGSLRIRDRQKEMARFARDLVRMTAEIMAERFDPMRLVETANLMPEGPEKLSETVAAVELLRTERLRSFRIDIETDSTIEPDENAEKQRRTEFVTAIGGLLREAVPLAATAPALIPVVSETILFLVRGYRAGRMMEDVIEKAAEEMQAAAKQPAGQPQDNPDAMRARAQIEEAQARLQMDGRKLEMEAAARQAGHHASQQMQVQEFGLKKELALLDFGLRKELAYADTALKAQGQLQDQVLIAQENNGAREQDSNSDSAIMKGLTEMAQSIREMGEAIVKSSAAPRRVTTPDGRTYTSESLPSGNDPRSLPSGNDPRVI